MEKVVLAYKNSNISDKQQDRTKITVYWGPTGSHLCVFDWCQNQRP